MPLTGGISQASNDGHKLYRSSSMTNTSQLESFPESTTEGGGLEDRFDMTGHGMDILDKLFGRGWSLLSNTGVISVLDSAFLRITNPDPLEKWYNLDPEPLARGRFTVLYHCEHRLTGVEYVAKFASRLRLGTDESHYIKHEVAIGAMLSHCDSTVRLHDVFATDAHIVMLMEYVPSGDLQTLLEGDCVPYERHAIEFLRQLLRGLEYIHSLGIVHLDIKPENAVLRGEYPNCTVKLCDFELARIVTPKHEIREMLGTPDYVAPETLNYEPITTKTDMWSLGVVTYALLTGFLPFSGDNDHETYREISKCNYDFSEELFEEISDPAMDFIRKLLVRCPSQRMSAKECLNHPWMKVEFKKSCMTLPIPSFTSSKSSTQPNTPTASWNGMDDWSASDTATNYNSNSRVSTMPIGILSPPCMTPTASRTPLSASPRDNMFVVHRPNSAYKANASTYSSTHSLYRENHIPNLEKIRSQSKSREVLVEKLQLANLKKNVSRSKERLFDGHLSLSRSGEQLTNNRLFSHSVEELIPHNLVGNERDYCLNKNSLYPYSVYSNEYDESFSTKLYKSLVSVENDKYNKGGAPNNSQTIPPKNPETRFSVNSMTDDEYSDYLSRFYPVVRSKTEEPQRTIENAVHHRSRNELTCDRFYSSNERPVFATQKITQTVRNNKTESSNHQTGARKKKSMDDSSKKHSKTERPKERYEKPSLKTEKTSSNKFNRTVPSDRRRNSISHVEQRIQERHERMLEKKLNMNKNDKKINSNKQSQQRRRHSTDSDKTKSSSNKKGQNSWHNSRKNSYPTANKSSNSDRYNNCLESTDQCISLNSVKEITQNVQTTEPSHTEDMGAVCSMEPICILNDVNSESLPEERLFENRDVDEAYVSLEETVDDGIFSRSESMDSSTTIESDNTINDDVSSSDTLHAAFQDIVINEIEHTYIDCNNSFNDNLQHNDRVPPYMPNIENENTNINSVREDEEKIKLFTRSTSTSSDIGSMLSEGSDLAFDELQRKISLTKELFPDYDNRNRHRSNSTTGQQNIVIPVMPFKLSRSNSVHLDTPLSGMPRPWGDVCQGSVGRAMTMFRQQSNDSTASSASSSSLKRKSFIWPTTEVLDNIIERNKSDEDLRENNPIFKISDLNQQNTEVSQTYQKLQNKKVENNSDIDSSMILPNKLTTSSSLSSLESNSVCYPSISFISKPKVTKPSSIPLRINQ